MYAIPVTIEKGKLSLPPNSKLPPEARSGILFVGDDLHPNDDLDSLEFRMAALRDNPALEFLEHEPDVYSIEDVKPENR